MAEGKAIACVVEDSRGGCELLATLRDISPMRDSDILDQSSKDPIVASRSPFAARS